MIKVVLIDDQLLLRESLSYLLENDDEIKVVGMGKNGKDAISLCGTLHPDVVLMDIEMPELDGVSATKIIKQKHCDIKVIMLTTFENPENIVESFICDADGYVVKDISSKDLTRAIKCVNNNLTVVDKSVKKIMVDKFKKLSNNNFQFKDIFTDREIQIIKCIASGKSNKEISCDLNFSQGTIKNNISIILEKLNMTDRIQIAIFAIENGIR